MIEELAKLIPQEFLPKSGSVFYSGRLAFSRPRPMYILGLNPGGDPVGQANETVGWHSDKVIRREPDDWSAYRDESWANLEPGTCGMQPRVLYMLNQLGIPPGQSPASNVVFLRTAREAQLKREFSALAELCWPFHAAAISGLKPRLVTCFGKTAGGYVRAKLKADKLVSEYVEQNSRRWKSSLFRNDGGLHVLVATHPSIAAWNSAQSDPTCLARQALA